jgi:uncharacterized repeat protein (TIGR01451 family)
MTTKQISTSLIATALFLCAAHPAFAQSYGSYGGTTPTLELVVNKLVQNPLTGLFVDNLGSTDPNFSPNAVVTYRLVVKNASTVTIEHPIVQDTLPQYLTFKEATDETGAKLSADVNSSTRVITFRFDKMTAGQTKTIDLRATVAARSTFPKDNARFCVTNTVTVDSDTTGSDDDRADMCILTGSIEYLPVAGFEDLATAIPFASLGGVGVLLTGLGLKLKKKKS